MSISTASSTKIGTTAEPFGIRSSSWRSVRHNETLLVSNVSLADYEDVPALTKLITPNTSVMFNTEDVRNKIHTSALSLLVKNKNGQTVAGICLADYPNVPALPSDDWVTWVKRLYGIHELDGYNTCWVHLAVYDELYEGNFIQPLMTYLFERNPKDYILFVVPPNCKVGYLKDISTMILPNDYKIPSKVQTLRMLMRQNFSIAYKVRRAVEEDNDDLVPLIDSYSKRLKDLYGAYYVAEIVTRHADSGRQLIVVEHKGLAVSVLCLNDNVNYQDLNQSFDLQVFTGLFKSRTYEQVSKDMSVHTVCTINTIFKASMISAMHVPHVVPIVPVADDTSSSSFSIKDLNSLNIDFTFPPEVEKVQPTDQATTDETNDLDFSFQVSALDFLEILGETDISDDDISLDFISPYQEYKGKENAFVIEIAASHPEHEYSLELLLAAAFECYPDKEYCILSVPSDKPYFNFLRQFIRVTPLRTALHPHELYIVHKIMLNPVSVRLAQQDDVDVVERFAYSMEHPGNLVEKFTSSLKDPESKLMTFFLISAHKKDNPLGVVMVNEVTDLEQLKVTYCIRNWHDMRREKNEDVGVIEYFVMSPLFRKQTRFFLREIHRMSSYLTLFYAINRFDNSSRQNRPLPSILPYLYPIKPRKIVIRDKSAVPIYEVPFSLYLTTPRLTGICRYEINTRIVVVGSSHVAIAFLENLLFSDHRKGFSVFNNVLLISKHGLSHSKPPNRVTGMMQACTTSIDYEYMERLNLRCYVNIMAGLVTSIDRNQKTVTVDKKQVIPYDLLFLMCGLQYNVPRKVGVKDYLNVKLAPNMFNINTETDAENALTALKNLTSQYKNQKYTVVVYGNTIDVYCCISSLLEFGVPPYSLTFVDQFGAPDKPPSHEFVVQDGDIFKTTMKTLKKRGVTILSGYKLIDWWNGSDDVKVVLKFESQLRYMELEAIAVFLYPEKSVNVEIWRAIIEAGLVFDGRLVVTPDCRTNDPSIYAAGGLTKYPRRYMADHLVHRFFNQEEIGETLGKTIRASLLPYEEDPPETNILEQLCWKDMQDVAPVYKRPIIVHCRLCTNLYYLKVRKPGMVVPREAFMSDDDFGSVLGTGNCKQLENQGYFRIHLNPHKVIETITCLSTKPFDYKKLILLWGKHETILNNLVKRFEFMYITDLFAFFESPWATAIYHDDFAKFEKDMMHIMMSKSEEEGISPLQDLFRLYEENDYKKLPPETSKIIVEKFKKSPYEAKIKKRLLNFIKDNLTSLNMYAHPVLVNAILTGYKESFLFHDL